MDTNYPNIFSYATSELSQDAFILWLLAWANPKYKEADKNLNAAAQAFVRRLLNKAELDVTSVECRKQEHDIDVLAIINGTYALVIEDKTDTTTHDNQLNKYVDYVTKAYSFCTEIHCVYYKSGNESKYKINKIESEFLNYVKDTESYFFHRFLRTDIKSLLEAYPTTNAIYVDYINNLQKLQDRTNSYAEKTVGQWGNTAWQGFYMKVEDKLGMGSWGNNPMESRMNKKKKKVSIWEYRLPKQPITEDKTIQLYLILELNKLFVKASCKGKCQPEKGWDDVINKLKGIHVDGLEIESSKNIKAGKNIKLVEVKRDGGDFISWDVMVDVSYVVEKLMLLQKNLSEVVNQK